MRHTDITDQGRLDRKPKRKPNPASEALERCVTRGKTRDEIRDTCDGRDEHARVLGVCCGRPVPALAAWLHPTWHTTTLRCSAKYHQGYRCATWADAH